MALNHRGATGRSGVLCMCGSVCARACVCVGLYRRPGSGQQAFHGKHVIFSFIQFIENDRGFPVKRSWRAPQLLARTTGTLSKKNNINVGLYRVMGQKTAIRLRFQMFEMVVLTYIVT